MATATTEALQARVTRLNTPLARAAARDHKVRRKSIRHLRKVDIETIFEVAMAAELDPAALIGGVARVIKVEA